jgi:hypothetical protein
MACRTCPQSGWPPASARVRPPDTRLDTVSADQFLLRTPGSGWTADRHGVPLDCPVAWTPQFKVTAQHGSGPGPDGDSQAADTSSAQRPPRRLAIWPRQSTRPVHPVLTGQDGNAHAPSANPSRYQQRDPPVMTTCTHARCRNVRKPGPRPISARSCPASTMDATIGQPSGHRMPGRIWPDTVPLHPDATRGSDADRGTDERHGRHSDIPDRHDHEDSLPGRRTPPLGGRCGLAAKIGSAMATLPAQP